MPRLEPSDTRLGSPVAGAPDFSGQATAVRRFASEAENLLSTLEDQRRRDGVTQATLEMLDRLGTIEGEVSTLDPDKRGEAFDFAVEKQVDSVLRGIPDAEARSRVQRSVGFRIAEQRRALVGQAIRDEKSLALAGEERLLRTFRTQSVFGATGLEREAGKESALELIRDSRWRSPAEAADREIRFDVETQEDTARQMALDNPEGFSTVFNDPELRGEAFDLVDPGRLINIARQVNSELAAEKRERERQAQDALKARSEGFLREFTLEILSAKSEGRKPDISMRAINEASPFLEAPDLMFIQRGIEDAAEPITNREVYDSFVTMVDDPSASNVDRDFFDRLIVVASNDGQLSSSDVIGLRNRNRQERAGEFRQSPFDRGKNRIDAVLGSPSPRSLTFLNETRRIETQREEAQARLRAFIQDSDVSGASLTQDAIDIKTNEIIVTLLASEAGTLSSTTPLPYGYAGPRDQVTKDVLLEVRNRIYEDYAEGVLGPSAADREQVLLDLWQRIERLPGEIEASRKIAAEAREAQARSGGTQ